MSLITAQNLSKTYDTDSVEVKAVQAVSFEIDAGSFLSFRRSLWKRQNDVA